MLLLQIFTILASLVSAQDFGQSGHAIQDVNIVSGSVSASTVVISGVITTQESFDIVAINVTVAGGTGFAVFSDTGTIEGCSTVPPTAIASYDFDITTNDSDGFPVIGRTHIGGKAGLVGPRLISGSHKAQFDNATPDGTYKARCVVKK